MRSSGNELAGIGGSWSRTADYGSLWANLCKLRKTLHRKKLCTQILWIKLNLYNPCRSPHPCFVRPPFMTHRQNVQPRVTLLSPPPPADFIHEISSSQTCLYSCFILGTKDPALQPPDFYRSQNPQPILVRSALAALNIEPLRDLINSSFRVCIMLLV